MPAITENTIPNTITGPAILNIFARMPKMKPSACVNLGAIIISSWSLTCYGFISLIKARTAVEAARKSNIQY